MNELGSPGCTKPNFKPAKIPQDGQQSHNSSQKYAQCLTCFTSVKPLHIAYYSYRHPQYVPRQLDIQTGLYLSNFKSEVHKQNCLYSNAS